MKSKPVAIVTGANRGIGEAIALDLSKAGYNIIGISRTLKTTGTKKGLEELRTKVETNGASFLPLQADISDIGSFDKLVAEIMKVFKRIDLLVNNAGVAPLERLDILETTVESYDRVMSINLRGAFFFTQKIANNMLDNIDSFENYNPKIIFITSASAEVSSPNRAEYCISKAGLSMASKVFADRLAGSDINVYEIRPGIIDTDMTAPVKEKYDKMIDEGLVPLYRWGKPSDISKVVVSIANGDLSYSTGNIIEISGGMNIRHL